jgi:hypothetical protein
MYLRSLANITNTNSTLSSGTTQHPNYDGAIAAGILFGAGMIFMISCCSARTKRLW